MDMSEDLHEAQDGMVVKGYEAFKAKGSLFGWKQEQMTKTRNCRGSVD
jgi:hypothetical protein